MISFVGRNHDMPYDVEARQLMNHFAVAFFGYYLQGHKDYKQYFSEDYVKQLDNLAWGIYEGE